MHRLPSCSSKAGMVSTGPRGGSGASDARLAGADCGTASEAPLAPLLPLCTLTVAPLPLSIASGVEGALLRRPPVIEADGVLPPGAGGSRRRPRPPVVKSRGMERARVRRWPRRTGRRAKKTQRERERVRYVYQRLSFSVPLEVVPAFSPLFLAARRGTLQ